MSDSRFFPLRGWLLLGCGLVSWAGGLRAAEFPGTLVLGRPTDSLIAANLIAPSSLSSYLDPDYTTGVY